MMLSNEDIAGMRETQEEALPDVATISRPTRVTDSAGGYTVTPVTVETTTCRLSKTRPAEVLAGNKEVTFTDWMITLPYDTDVQAGDTITINALNYQVISKAAGSWNTALRAYCIGLE